MAINNREIEQNVNKIPVIEQDIDGLTKQMGDVAKQIDSVIYYNICDYEGDTLNKKWDNMRKEFVAWQPKEILIPIPRPNQSGAMLTTTGWKWVIDGTILFDDKCNCCKVLVYDEIVAITNIDVAVKIKDVAKPEDIIFEYGLRIRGNRKNNAKITNGLVICDSARVDFKSNVVINDCVNGIILGGDEQTNPVEVMFDRINIAFCDEVGILVYGKTKTVTFNINDLTVQTMQLDNKSALKIIGDVVLSNLNKVRYYTDIEKNGYLAKDTDSVVFVSTSSENKAPREIQIGAIYGINSFNGIKIVKLENTTAITKDIYIGYIRVSKTSGDMRAYDIDNVVNFEVNSIGEYNVAFIRNGVRYTSQCNKTSTKIITDESKRHRINNLVTTSLAFLDKPSTGDYPLGSIITNNTINGDRVYLKYKDTGVTNDDLIPIDGQMFIPKTDSLPTPAWNLRGKMFIINNDTSGGTDTVYICKRKNGVYTWVEIGI